MGGSRRDDFGGSWRGSWQGDGLGAAGKPEMTVAGMEHVCLGEAERLIFFPPTRKTMQVLCRAPRPGGGAEFGGLSRGTAGA